MCCGFSGFRAPRAAALAVPLAALFDVDPGEELMVAVAWSVEGSLEMARVGGVNRDRLDQLVDGLERKLGQEKAVGRRDSATDGSIPLQPDPSLDGRQGVTTLSRLYRGRCNAVSAPLAARWCEVGGAASSATTGCQETAEDQSISGENERTTTQVLEEKRGFDGSQRASGNRTGRALAARNNAT